MEERIKKIKSQGLDAFLDYASIGIILVDKSMNIILTNNFALKMFGYQEHELVGQKLELLIPNRFREEHKNHHNKFYNNPQNRPMGQGMDLFAISKNGTELPVEVSLGTYYIEGDLYVIAFINNITLRKQNEDSIRKLNAELEKKVSERTEALGDAIVKLQKQIKETEEAEKELAILLAKEKELGELKSRFVSMASHEFRTPLSTILSSVYLLQQYVSSEDQPKRDKHLDRILNSVNTLNEILEDFLSVGKIEEGKVNIDIQPIDLPHLVSDIKSQYSSILKPNQKLILDHTGPIVVHSDANMLKYILVNLISNAAKFSEDNKIIQIITSVSSTKEWYLSVKDQGIGIPFQDQKNLFERFYRASNTANIKGTGLGLHIVSKYTNILGGSVHFNSTPGIGTEFIVNFKPK